jgi:hypothetical protein
MGAPTKALKTSWYFKGKNVIVKKFMLKILIYFNSPITEH